MFKSRGSFASVLALALVFPLLSVAAADSYRALSVVRTPRKPASDFSLKQVGGKSIKLSRYRGDVVLLGFFKTF